MKVLLTKPFFETDVEYIKSKLDENIRLIIPQSFDTEAIQEEAKDADVLLGGMISEAILQEAKKLKFIQIPWTGVDNLNFELLAKYNTVVCNSHSNATIVAEHAIALMLDAAKKISYHDRLMRKGNWNRPGINLENKLTPFSKPINKSTIAIVGYGSIGKKIQQFLSGFECNFKIFNRELKQDLKKELKISYFSVEDLENELHDVDFVFISVPLTEVTRGFVDNTFFSAMNENGVLINISRGEVLNENDLYQCLNENKIGYAAIDTWYNYPSKDNPIAFPSLKNNFQELDNIILSPHRAGYINSGFPHLDDAIENLNRQNRGEDLKNIISIDKKY
ncbi:2-hydroxyacid dehydrogenase [Flavobacterium soli]|uniref:2-hydroxyacid dehydrogenase n=1 Tax=Flavobacterium soli TaxID=344881 RepID=UPI0004259CF8|nr:2-hydroxyacid dehydrogenase [Flavobacterium soli]